MHTHKCKYIIIRRYEKKTIGNLLALTGSSWVQKMEGNYSCKI